MNFPLLVVFHMLRRLKTHELHQDYWISLLTTNMHSTIDSKSQTNTHKNTCSIKPQLLRSNQKKNKERVPYQSQWTLPIRFLKKK